MEPFGAPWRPAHYRSSRAGTPTQSSGPQDLTARLQNVHPASVLVVFKAPWPSPLLNRLDGACSAYSFIYIDIFLASHARPLFSTSLSRAARRRGSSRARVSSLLPLSVVSVSLDGSPTRIFY